MENEKMMELKKAVLEEAGWNPANITDALISDVAEMTGRDGLDYLWYVDDEGLYEACMRVDTEEFIDDDEIEALLACSDN